MMKTKLALIAASVMVLSVFAGTHSEASTTFKSGISCVGKDKVANVCLPKSRKKYPGLYESNYLSSCVKSAGGGAQAGTMCGCSLVQMESRLTYTKILAIEQDYAKTGTLPQVLKDIVAYCGKQ
jgi:hypothetical protein